MLRSTNVIESAFSIVRVVCRNVKRWRPGNQIERWVGSGLLVAEKQFRRIDGYRFFAESSQCAQCRCQFFQVVRSGRLKVHNGSGEPRFDE